MLAHAPVMRSRCATSPTNSSVIPASFTMYAACDVVVVAGKGHEDCQIVGTGTRAFSDRETVKACLSGDAA